MLADESAELRDTEPVAGFAGGVAESVGSGGGLVVLAVASQHFLLATFRWLGDDDVIGFGFERAGAIAEGNHLLMQFFAWPDTDDRFVAFGTNGFGEVGDAVGRNAWDKNLTTQSTLESAEDHLHPLLECDVETGHVGVGDGQHAGSPPLHEEGDDGPARPHDIAIADDTEAQVAGTFYIASGDKELVGAELGGAIEIDGGRRLVSGESDKAADGRGVENRFDEVLRA